MALEPTDQFDPTQPVDEALQSGPWLVRDRHAETGLDSRMIARRTFICHDGRGRWALGASGECTLQDLAQVLREAPIVKALDVAFALNLDGGPSTGSWVRHAPADFYLRENWSGRNFIAIVPKAAR